MSGSTILAFMALAGAGTTLRWMATGHWLEGHRGTLLVNVIGAFLLGLLAGSGASASAHSPRSRASPRTPWTSPHPTTTRRGPVP